MITKFSKGELIIKKENMDTLDSEEPDIWIIIDISKGSSCEYYYTRIPMFGDNKTFLSIANHKEDLWVSLNDNPDIIDRFPEYVL